MRRVAIALLWADGRLLLQLRDFSPDIYDPGLWGLFGGHLAPEESEDAGMRRELSEELAWCPALTRLGSFTVDDVILIGYRGVLDVPLNALVLAEGQDLAAFTIPELESGQLYSPRLRKSFSMTAITREALRIWCGLRQDVRSADHHTT
jgi:8-oxo-dGTP pyrophosphatase MutT (NUDIX family)